MDHEQAAGLIRDTFEKSFDRGRFADFARNLLQHVSGDAFVYRGNYIPDAFAPHIAALERIGKYEDTDDKRLDILVAQLRKETSLVHARTMQRNFIAWYLNGSRGGQQKDGALVAFVSPNESDWRFSLVKMEYKLAETPAGRPHARAEYSPARRYSFLVGANEGSHTAQSQLVPVLEQETPPTLDRLEQAFSVEKVTKEFFTQYRDLFIRIKDAIDRIVRDNKPVREDFKDKGINSVDFAKKLLGQVVFLHFLQKKGWFGVGRDAEWGEGPKDFLRRLFRQEYGSCRNFFNDVLEPLFYEALACERPGDFYSRFNCKIPFLNGGLFDPIGGYDWIHADVALPDDLFSNEEQTAQGDIGTGILDVFDRYNFTVCEDEPLEREVAIDPELLGKLYEKFNAINAGNYAEYKEAIGSKRADLERKFNKKYGVYYTPRDIVQYISQQTLIDYLTTALHGTVSRFDLEFLVRHGEELVEREAVAQLRAEQIAQGKLKTTRAYKSLLPEAVSANAAAIDAALDSVRVCDPAIGSGAFPVGMMSEIVRTRSALDPFLDCHRTTYDLKRHAIQNSLYGVDIDPGAVEIAKLRLWLSLVVDEQERKDIKSLPNLDYKVMQGDSLVSEFAGLDLDALELGEMAELDFGSADLRQLVTEFKTKKDEYLREPHMERKKTLRTEIDELVVRVFSLELQKKRSDFATQLRRLSSRARQIASKAERDRFMRGEKAKLYRDRRLSPQEVTRFKQYLGEREARPFFFWKLYFAEVFAEKGGFDIVVGNPPYVRQEKLTESKEYLCLHYDVYSGTADLYAYFIERGVELLHPGGHFAYIVSNKWLRADYGSALRTWLKSQRIQEIIDFGDLPVFENVTTYPCILRVARGTPLDEFRMMDAESLDYQDLADYVVEHGYRVQLTGLSSSGWSLGRPATEAILKKLRAAGVPLGEYVNGKIYRGILTGLNEAFVIGRATRDRLVDEDKRSVAVIKPFLVGRDVKRYRIDDKGKFLILMPNGWTRRHMGAARNAWRWFSANYAAVANYLAPFEERAEKRCDRGEYWWELRPCDYYGEFEMPKIVCPDISPRGNFAYDGQGSYYLVNTAYIFPSADLYLLGILNSCLLTFSYSHISSTYQGGYLRFIYQYLAQLPIRQSASEDKAARARHDRMVELVEMMLDLHQQFEKSPGSSRVKSRIADTDKEVDELVYDLYGLTKDEIKIVEEDRRALG